MLAGAIAQERRVFVIKRVSLNFICQDEIDDPKRAAEHVLQLDTEYQAFPQLGFHEVPKVMILIGILCIKLS